MTTTSSASKHDERLATGRRLRQTYEALDRGERATLRRCTTADEMLVEGAFWRLRKAASVDDGPERVAHLVALFPCCDGRVGDFRLGRLLEAVTNKGAVAPKTTPIALRQLLACRDGDELVRRLRRVLTASGRAIDWGVLYADLCVWLGSDEGRQRVCRRWVQDFYHDNDTNGPSHDGR